MQKRFQKYIIFSFSLMFIFLGTFLISYAAPDNPNDCNALDTHYWDPMCKTCITNESRQGVVCGIVPDTPVEEDEEIDISNVAVGTPAGCNSLDTHRWDYMCKACITNESREGVVCGIIKPVPGEDAPEELVADTVLGNDGSGSEYTPLVTLPGLSGNSGSSIPDFVNTVYKLAIALGALLGVIKIAAAGVKYSMSDVVTDKSSAKKDIMGVLLGLAILLMPFIVLNTIYPGLTDLDFTDGLKGPQPGDDNNVVDKRPKNPDPGENEEFEVYICPEKSGKYSKEKENEYRSHCEERAGEETNFVEISRPFNVIHQPDFDNPALTVYSCQVYYKVSS
ncbi:MAG: hypothetical protein DRI24_23630 [Deltaproteobacteria bacterium]|nr:MAG: hypothetical protein DRI24_23630 [Deltaproteobacteria bacterium]